MNDCYLSFSTSERSPIECKSPVKHQTQALSIEDSIDLILDYQVDTDYRDSYSEIDLWLKRKWQVCLDYYLHSQKAGKRVSHPPPSSLPNIDIMLPSEKNKEHHTPIEALIHRKTYRKFQNEELELAFFSQLLLELKEELLPDIWHYYLVIFNVKGIRPGIYRYHPQEHGLSLIKPGLFRDEAVKLLCGMSASLFASFLLILSVDIPLALQYYPYNRALREIYIDSGRIAQKLLIRGMQSRIGGLPSPAMRDTPMCAFLNIDPMQCIPLYSLTMGIIPMTKGL